MTGAAKQTSKTEVVEIHDPSKLRGRLKMIGGSMSDDWNNGIANQTVSALWLEHADTDAVKKYRHAAVDALIGIAPRDELEGMIAAQLVACHNASMECYRRAMIGEQTFEGRKENLSQANKLSRTYATLLESLNRHRGKGAQKVTVEHVHVHDGGQAIVGTVESRGGRAPVEIKGTTPCNCPCTRRPDAKPEHAAGARANRQQCRTAGVGCTADRHRARRRGIRTPSSTAAILKKP
jgi:hypothetical protein